MGNIRLGILNDGPRWADKLEPDSNDRKCS